HTLTAKLENAFANRDGIAGKNREVATVAASQTFRIHPNDFVFAGTGMTADADSLRGGDASVTSGHGNRFQQINAFRASIGHFIAARAIDLAEHGKTTLGITDQHHIDPGIDQVIASVEVGEPRGSLGERESGEMNRAKQWNAQVALAIQASVGAQI